MKKILKVGLLILVAILSGCSEPEETIEEKVVNRWGAIISSDYEKAYSYLSPSYREVESLTSYSVRMETAKIHTQWESAEFVSKNCDEELCEVKVSITYIYSFPRKSMGTSKMVTDLSEKWINKSGVWYLLPKK